MGGVILTLALGAATACQQQLNVPDADLEPVDEIIFRTADPSLDAEVSTKATAVTSLSSFNVSAVTGSAGSETAVWTNVAFSGNNDDGFKAAAPGKWWPAEDASYRFYASNSALTFAASGATVAATNATDVICAYAAAPSYKAKNTLSFEHIFARLGAVTVSAATGYTISNVSIKITPKTGGTYNLLTGAGQTDGTGWSGLTTGSETTIASATGANTNDIYLVPGTYTLTASWTATKGDYTENIENMTCDVSLVAGKINNISTTLSGNAKEIVFNVNIAPWTDNNQVVEFPTKIPTFGGLQIASGNLYKTADGWAIANSPLDGLETFGSKYGASTTGSYYFNFLDMGALFEKAGFATSDGNIENLLDPLDGWRLPTKDEWTTLTTGTRSGASVTHGGGSASGVKYYKVLVDLTGSAYAGKGQSSYSTNGGAGASTYNATNYQAGLLLFPDDASITTTYTFPTAANTTNVAYLVSNGSGAMTYTQLTDLLSQGCALLPAAGYYSNGSWWRPGYGTIWWSSTQSGTNMAYNLSFDYSDLYPANFTNKSPCYSPVRLVRTTPPSLSQMANGHDYVDLGLRYGGNKILFATMNVGASSPEEYGDHFAWGETSKRYTDVFDWSNCPFHSGGNEYNTGYWSKYVPTGCESFALSGVADNKLILDASDDVAAVQWGGSWRIPTPEELCMLLNGDGSSKDEANICSTVTSEYIYNSETGIAGVIFRGTGAFSAASLFIPDHEGGTNYMSSSLSNNAFDVWAFFLSTDGSYNYPNASRCQAFHVRPVLVVPE